MGVETRLLLVPELMEEPRENVTENEVMQEVVDENQSDLDQLMAYRSSVHDTMGVIPAKLMVELKTRIPGNLMFESCLLYTSRCV